MSRIVVVSAHPDDEILGLGGTLIRHRKKGDSILWVIVTDLFEEFGFSHERIESRKEEINQVASQLGINKVVHFDYPTMQLSSLDLNQMIPKISAVFNQFQPERIYLLNRSDDHSYHRVAFEAVYSCTKSFRYPFIREVFMYECLSETEFAPPFVERAFIPNCFVDISKEMDEKLALMRIYESELGEHPFPRSERNIKSLASYRGAMSGVEYAEAFQILKSFRFETL